jgi:hypothetical protein
MTIRRPLTVGVMVAALFTGGTGLANAAILVPTPWDSHSVPADEPTDDSAPTGYGWLGSVPTGHHSTGSAPDGQHDNSVPTGHFEGS